MSNIIKCFLTVTPNEMFYDFIKQLPDIDNIYICIVYKYYLPYSTQKIKFVQI